MNTQIKKVPMTVNGADMLRDELEHLKKTVRPQVIKAISEARAHGDLKENAEYHAAKEQQGFVETRIQEIETKLANAQIIDITTLTKNGKVVFGSTVELLHVALDKTVTYQIVGEDEADIKDHKISVTSPMARALIGKEIGDVVEVITPNGPIEYEIEDVEYI